MHSFVCVSVAIVDKFRENNQKIEPGVDEPTKLHGIEFWMSQSDCRYL